MKPVPEHFLADYIYPSRHTDIPPLKKTKNGIFLFSGRFRQFKTLLLLATKNNVSVLALPLGPGTLEFVSYDILDYVSDWLFNHIAHKE